MQLAEYLEKHDLSAADFAARLGVTPEAVRLWRRGLRLPRRDVMRKIMAETGGKVSADDFMAGAA